MGCMGKPSSRMRSPALLVFCFAAFAATTARADAIDDYVASQMRKQHIAGLSLAVIKDGKPVKLKGYGSANLELDVPVTADTVFKIGSVSKQFIASGIMLLVDDGKVSLDDKISKYLESPPATWSDITVRHVLSHTSGLLRESPGFAAFKIQSDADVIKSAYGEPLRFRPGEKFEYCNLGYFILGEIIRKASGKEWPAFMDERVFKPLQMTATRTTDTEAIVPNRANGYAFKNGKRENAVPFLALRPSGAFLSTAVDMAKWNAALDAGRILSRKTLDLMWTPVKLNNGEATPYGLGWYLDPVAGHRRVRHGGSMTGFRAEFARLVDDGLSIIVLTNAEAAMPDIIATGIASQFAPDLIEKRETVHVEPQVLDGHVGRYATGSSGLVNVTRDGAGLLLVFTGNGVEMSLAPLSPTRFFWTDSPRTEVVFDTKPSGEPTQLTMTVNGVEQLKGSRVQ